MKRFARRYTISIKYEPFELFTQGEYFVDAAIHAENFFYSWSELSCAPASWFRVGVVVDWTKAFGSKFDIRRGPLVGFKYKKVDFTTYWLSPGSKEATFVLPRPQIFERWPDYDVPGIRFLYSLDSQPIGRTVLTGPILLTSHAKKPCERQRAASIRLKSNTLCNVRWSNS